MVKLADVPNGCTFKINITKNEKSGNYYTDVGLMISLSDYIDVYDISGPNPQAGDTWYNEVSKSGFGILHIHNKRAFVQYHDDQHPCVITLPLTGSWRLISRASS